MSHELPPPNCLNCHAELHGPFCHDCGQKAAAPVRSLHDFVHDAVHEFLHFDGKIIQTVKLLVVKPGHLTREFIEGRRASYISPLRVYLTFSLIFFALAAVVPGARESFVKVGPAKGDVLQRAEQERRADELGEALMHNMPRAAFLLMPAFALLTWLFYRREQPYYVPHLYFAVHFHAFAFFVLSVAMLLGLAGSAGKLLGGIVFLAIFPYHYIALKRMFGGSRWSTFARGTAIGVLYWLVLAMVMLGLAWTSIRSLS